MFVSLFSDICENIFQKFLRMFSDLSGYFFMFVRMYFLKVCSFYKILYIYLNVFEDLFFQNFFCFQTLSIFLKRL